jgi:endonuclease/exonuclease/phosphatase family metal-dependent hydrolase
VVRYDFLQILLDALSARGKNYAAIATVDNLGGEVPAIDASSPTGLQLVGLVDRDVLLVRSDLPRQVLDASNAMSARFDARLSFVGPLGPVEATRGWVSADVTLNGVTARVIGTHLERVDADVQEAQAQELIDGPAATSMPVVLLGDFNSAAGGVGAVPGESDTRTYEMLLDAGFADAWKGTAAGFSCCQAEDLRNPISTLSERIDLVLTRDARALMVHEFGDQQPDRTASGLWPSDHAGMAAAISVGNA